MKKKYKLKAFSLNTIDAALKQSSWPHNAVSTGMRFCLAQNTTVICRQTNSQLIHTSSLWLQGLTESFYNKIAVGITVWINSFKVSLECIFDVILNTCSYNPWRCLFLCVSFKLTPTPSTPVWTCLQKREYPIPPTTNSTITTCMSNQPNRNEQQILLKHTKHRKYIPGTCSEICTVYM